MPLTLKLEDAGWIELEINGQKIELDLNECNDFIRSVTSDLPPDTPLSAEIFKQINEFLKSKGFKEDPDKPWSSRVGLRFFYGIGDILEQLKKSSDPLHRQSSSTDSTSQDEETSPDAEEASS